MKNRFEKHVDEDDCQRQITFKTKTYKLAIKPTNFGRNVFNQKVLMRRFLRFEPKLIEFDHQRRK